MPAAAESSYYWICLQSSYPSWWIDAVPSLVQILGLLLHWPYNIRVPLYKRVRQSACIYSTLRLLKTFAVAPPRGVHWLPFENSWSKLSLWNVTKIYQKWRSQTFHIYLCKVNNIKRTNCFDDKRNIVCETIDCYNSYS